MYSLFVHFISFFMNRLPSVSVKSYKHIILLNPKKKKNNFDFTAYIFYKIPIWIIFLISDMLFELHCYKNFIMIKLSKY